MGWILGPLLFWLDESPDNKLAGMILTLTLGAGMFQFFLNKSNPFRALLAVAALVTWILCGMLGAGINV